MASSVLALSVRRAFVSWWNVLGALTTSVTLFNLMANLRVIDPIELLDVLLEAYRAVFHTPIAIVASLVGVQVPEWGKNLIVLWFMVGGATARVLIGYAKARREHSRAGIRQSGGGRILERFLDRSPSSLIICAAIFLWPVILVILWRKPLFQVDVFEVGHGAIMRFVGRLSAGSTTDGVLFDVRLVFAAQMALAVGVVIVFALINYSWPAVAS